MIATQVLVAFVALVAIALYAIFGGADFGGGVWDVLASGPRRRQQQDIIGHAIGPVWETNHVWLIFVIVLLFTCFPPAFASLSVGLFVPITFALVGIILRGAAYAFRVSAEDTRLSQIWGHVFGIASIVTPFFFGAAVGGLTVGGYAWTSAFAISTGLLAVALCAQIGAVFLTLETLGPLREDFRVRAIAATFALAVLGAVALGVAAVTSHETFAGLTQPHSLIGVGIAMTLGVLVLGALWFHMYHAARFAVALESIAVLAGWYASQAPYVIPHELTYAQAAAPQATLVDFLWLCAGGSVLLIPSLIFLFSIFKSDVHEPT